MGIQSSTDSHLNMSAKLFSLVCLALTCGVQGRPQPGEVYATPGCRTTTTYETTYITECETTYDTEYEMKCGPAPEPKCSGHGDHKECRSVGPSCYRVPKQVPREDCSKIKNK